MNSEILQVENYKKLSTTVLDVIDSEIRNRDVRINDCFSTWNIVIEFENEDLGKSFCNWLSENHGGLHFYLRSWWDGFWYVNFGRRNGSDDLCERAISQVIGKVYSNGKLLPRKSLEELWGDFLNFMDVQIEKRQIPKLNYGFHSWAAVVKFDRSEQALVFFDWVTQHRHKLSAMVASKPYSYGEVVFGCVNENEELPPKETLPVIGRFCLNGEFSQE